jgi:hypothetical protein
LVEAAGGGQRGTAAGSLSGICGLRISLCLLLLHYGERGFIWKKKQGQSHQQRKNNDDVHIGGRGCTGEFWNKYISLKYIFSELNVVDMVCWINSHQKKVKKTWHPFHNGKNIFFHPAS